MDYYWKIYVVCIQCTKDWKIIDILNVPKTCSDNWIQNTYAENFVIVGSKVFYVGVGH